MRKSKLRYGKKDVLPSGEFEPKKSKVRISIVIDGDILEAYKEAAKKTSHGEYQTLMKEKLRDAIFGKQVDSALRATIVEIVREELAKTG